MGLDEPGPLADDGVGAGVGPDIVAGDQRVSRWLAELGPGRWINDPPAAARQRVDLAAGTRLVPERRLLDRESTPGCPRRGDGVDLHHPIFRAVDVDIQPKVEPVLVWHRRQVGRH